MTTSSKILNKGQIRDAAKLWRAEPGRDGFRESRLYDVIIDGKPYPPKAISAFANEIAGNGKLRPNDFVGAREGKWHRELKRLGFEIRPKTTAVFGQEETIFRYRDDDRFIDCPRAFLVTGTQAQDSQNRSLLKLNQSGYWFLKHGRMKSGDALFVILPSLARGGYPRELFCGVLSEDPRQGLQEGRCLFQVERFHLLDAIGCDVKRFLGDKLPPQGDRVGNVWDDEEDLEDFGAAVGMGGDIDDEDSYPEGAESFRQHKTRERNSKVVKLAKMQRLRTTGKLACDACGFDFLDVYGERGRGFIEAHHTTPLALSEGPSSVRIKDFSMVCSNCHRMLHRLNPLMTASELKVHLAAVLAEH
ncbi:hypothetical protein GmRootA79_46680 [Acidovorax sp. A79]|uniref:HNH endonuclease n=1 Tax=Acidovorax sp. A79 TaxID=3056107 RepID=UPI0034E8EB4B